MKLALAAITLIASAAVSAAEPVYDRQLIIDAGRAYIEARLRNTEPKPALYDWKNPTIKAIAKLEGRNHGYVAVFFPRVGAPGVAFAFFAQIAETPLHWVINRFGTEMSQESAMAHFEQSVNNGSLLSQMDE